MIGLLAAPLARADKDGPSLAVMVSNFDLGELSPKPEALVSPGAFSIELRVRSPRPLQLALMADPSTIEAGQEQVYVSVEGTWLPLHGGLPVLIARTEATSGGGASLVIPMRVQSTFDSTPGKRDRRLFLMLDGERLDAPLQVTYSVPAVADLEPDGSEFRVLAGKPAEEHRYDFPARTYRVRSNSPWAVEVVSRADTVTKEPYFLEVQCEDGSFVKVSPDTPVRAASGPKTGSGGVSVPVRLRVTLGDLAPAGEYGSPLEVRTRLLD